MDMQHYYDGGPVYDVQKYQVPIMTRLNKESAGHLFGFVAWDPLRADGLLIVKTALAHGFVGVKFYAPNGYRPAGNAGKNGAAIDRANDTLFAFCQSNHIPIFAHCTPEGFESMPLYGCFADPKYWFPVLDKYKDLRLCLGHAGGEEWWLDKPGNPCKAAPFGASATDLCLRSENVYLEVAYMNDLRSAGGQQKFVSHVKGLMAKGDKITKRLCYGTDWMMPEMFIQGPTGYLSSLRSVFSDAALAPWADRFFFANAVEYLNLPDFVDRHSKYSPHFLTPSSIATVQQLLK
jgi:predicted TIM-barrel fold metal-dependent hydrolase